MSTHGLIGRSTIIWMTTRPCFRHEVTCISGRQFVHLSSIGSVTKNTSAHSRVKLAENKTFPKHTDNMFSLTVIGTDTLIEDGKAK